MKRFWSLTAVLLCGLSLTAADLLTGARVKSEGGDVKLSNGVLTISGRTPDNLTRNYYLTAHITLPQAVNLKGKAITFKVTGSGVTQKGTGMFFRTYADAAKKSLEPQWSFVGWQFKFTDKPRTFIVVPEQSRNGLRWETPVATTANGETARCFRFFMACNEPAVDLKFTISDMKVIPVPKSVAAGASFTAPADFMKELNGVQKIGSAFGNLARQKKASRPDGFAIEYDRGAGKYAGIVFHLKKPISLEDRAVKILARGNEPASGIYFRFYNKGNKQPVWSLSTWGKPVGKTWKEFTLQRGGSAYIPWEPVGIGDNSPANNVDRFEVIIGEHASSKKIFDLEIADIRLAKPAEQITKLKTVAKLMREMDYSGDVVILHPNTPAGKKAAAIVAKAVPGAKVRPGTAADRSLPAKATILLGNVFNNPAMLQLYARRQFPADQSFPGAGKYFVSAVPEAFRVGQSVVGVGASDDNGLLAGAKVLAKELTGKNKVLDATCFATNREIPKAKPNHIEAGMKIAQQRLDNGVHTSLGGYLATIGNRYIQNRQSADAKLYAEVCRLYAKTAVPDARKFGGPWGFDSDFMSFDALNGYDAVEHDPILTDEDRKDITLCLARWLVEAIVQEAQGGLNGNDAVWNHLTFCSQGTMVGAYYFQKYYPHTEEPKVWEKIAKHNFGRQVDCTKAVDDCNGYQWHVWNHLMTYTNASGDMTFITNGTGEKVLRSMLLTMDNYGLQVPYGDTGSWKCWLSEVPVLQAYHAATKSPLAEYILKRKREWTLPNGVKSVVTANNYLGELPADIPEPKNFFGVQKLDLEPKYYTQQGANGGMPIEKCFDKLSMRENFDRQGFYILIDGVNNGGHKHADGNAILRHTQYDRIWLADNDYFKSQQKFHNTLLVNINGEAGKMEPYIEYLTHGENDNFGWYAGKARKLAEKADWTRYIIWLKQEKAYAVLDRVTVNQDAKLLLKQRWNGMGDVTPKADGAILTQKGPAMRLQGYTANRYNYADDHELGKNWAGYPHAARIVRVLDQISEKTVLAGESALIGSVWHGSADGAVAPWRVTELANGMKIDTGKTACVITVDDNGELNIKETASAGAVTEKAGADNAAAKLPGQAFRKLWYNQKGTSGKFYFTQHARHFPFTLTGTKVTSANQLVSGARNEVKNLIDGSWEDADDSVMLAPGQKGDWTLTFQTQQVFTSAAFNCWWANASSKGTRHQIRSCNIYVDGKKVASRDFSGERYPNFGKAREFVMDFKPVKGKAIRYEIIPEPGHALYLCELLPAGPPPVNVRIQNVFEEYTSSAKLGNDLLAGTAASTLRCFTPQGTIRWEKALKHGLIHCITVADLDGDNTPEILCGTAGNTLLVLNNDGSERNKVKMEHYRVGPEVTIVRVADITGDGKPEILVGCDNWRTYAFTADLKFMWHYEVVHPTRAVTVADVTGDGIPEILCGTKYYSMSVLNNKGIRIWASNFGPGCRTIETLRAADGSIRVVAGSDDGLIYFHTGNGKRYATFNTGDEVRVQAVTGKGKDQKLWAGSFNGYVYQFNANGKLLTYTAIPGEVTTLQALPDGSVLAGTSTGAVVQLSPAGKVVKNLQLGGRVSSITLLGNTFGVTTQNGEVALYQR